MLPDEMLPGQNLARSASRGAAHSWSLPRGRAFAAALIGAPLAIAAAGGALSLLGEALFISFFSVVGFIILLSAPFGAASYLLVGGPLFWRAARRGKRRSADYAIAGFIANFFAALLAIPIVGLASILLGMGGAPEEPVVMSLVVHGFGLLFAPAYGFVFGMIFTRLWRQEDPARLEPEKVAAVFR